MPGIEIHAQLLENIVGQSWSARPAWARTRRARALCARRSCPHRHHATAQARSRRGSLPRPASRCRSSPARAAFVAPGGWSSTAQRPPSRCCSCMSRCSCSRSANPRASGGVSSARCSGSARRRLAWPESSTRPAGSSRASCRAPTAARRAPHRPRGDDDTRARDGRRPLRLLHARRAAPVLHGRRRRRQGPVGERLHGRQQGALQERDAARARRRRSATCCARRTTRSRATIPRCCSSRRLPGCSISTVAISTTATPATRTRTCSRHRRPR